MWLSFSQPVVFNSLWPHGLQDARPVSPFPEVCPSSCPLHQWCDPVISSSDTLSPPLNLSQQQIFLQLFTSDDQDTCFNSSISPSNEYSVSIYLKIDCLDLLAVQGALRSLLQHHSLKASILQAALRLLYHSALPIVLDRWKAIALTIRTFVGRVMSLFFSTLFRFVIDFLPRIKDFLISWLQSPFAVILEPTKRKSVTTSTFSSSTCHEVMGLDTMILVSLIFSFKLALSLSSSTLIKRLFSSSLLSAVKSGITHISEVVDVSPAYLDYS